MTCPPRILLALSLAGACHTPPPPLDLPVRQPEVQYRHGAPSNAGLTDRVDAVAAPRRFAVELYAVTDAPPGTAVARAAAAIIRDRGVPFRGRSRLPIGARWLSADAVRGWLLQRDDLDASRLQVHGDSEALLDASLVTWLSVADTAMPRVRLQPAVDGARVSLLTPADELEPREELTIAKPIAPGDDAGLFVPNAPLGLGGFLLLLRAQDAPDAAAIAAAVAQADAAQTTPTADRLPEAWQVALSAVGERNRRPALLALCKPYGVPRALDLVLAADEQTLINITDALRPLDPSAEGIAWQVERAVWRAVLPRIERGEAPPPLFAAAVRHLGALGDDAATLDLLLQTSADEAAFAGALREENLAALDDREAAARVAAHIWLLDKGVEVAAYDPMADRRTRRRALRRHWAKEQR